MVGAGAARFCMPFSQVGMCTELGSSYLLPFYVGMHKAKEWALLGETFDAAEALEAGLVKSVAPVDQVTERAGRYVERLESCAPRSLRATKRLMAAAHRVALANILLAEAEELRVGFRSEEAAEAIDAFAARRKPDFGRFR
jgi:2-(1,2-epoxy-1,2-dihydrophenyl)acetyl-CoA isomerase